MRKKIMHWLPVLCYLLAILGFSITLGFNRTVLCDYIPIDGDFQSYNVFRRMLAGQLPYTDFSNYIGMAPIWINLPFLVFSGSFANSLFITNFTANMLFAVAVFLLFYLVTDHRNVSMLASALCAKIISTQILPTVLGQGIGSVLTERFVGLYTPSNSMRIARSFLPFLLILILLCIEKLPFCKGFDLRQVFASARSSTVVGGMLGLLFLWSSDYSLACFATTCILFVLLHLCFYRTGFKTFARCFALFLLTFSCGALLCAALVTGGHPMAWLASLRGTGEAQYYYFNGIGGLPVLVYLFTKPEFLLWAGVCTAYLLWLSVQLLRRTITPHALALYFILASVLAGTMAYILAGSGYNAREPLEIYTLLAGLALVCKFALWLLRKYHKAVSRSLGVLVCCVGIFLCAETVQTARANRTPPNGTYIEGLGGYSTYTAALLDAAAVVGEDEIFSIYATGLEAASRKYQPSGYDYIIHALGENAQQAYLNTFLEGEYNWVQTPRMPIDGWVGLQNWYFYRHLFRDYQKVFATEYSWIWARLPEEDKASETGETIYEQSNPEQNTQGNTQQPTETTQTTGTPAPKNVTVTVTHAEDGSVSILCESERQERLIADVAITYDTAFPSTLAAFLNLGRRSISVTSGALYPDDNTYYAFALDGEGQANIPIIMKNGVGRATLSTVGMSGGSVTLFDAFVETCLPSQTLWT